MSEETQITLDIKKLQAAIVEKNEELKGMVIKANEEATAAGTVATETKAAIDGIAEKLNEMTDRVMEMEQNGVKIAGEEDYVDIGADFIKSEVFKDMQESRTGRARMEFKAAIINATGASQPLVAADRLAGINTVENRALMVRDLLPSSGTSSNLIEFVRENVFTNSASTTIAGSPEAFENVTKPESGITFTLASEAVQTLAHWIPASKQVIEDSQQLQTFISGRLMYGLKLYEENQLVSGTGVNGQLNGIYTQATAYTVQSPQMTNKLDIIREMIKQCQIANFTPDAILMNPQDWYEIDVLKVGSSATDIRYVVGNPRGFSNPGLWGIPVVVTNAMTAGTVLVGAFARGAEIKDRMQASVEVSRENSDNFVKNMVTVLAEERIALCVYRTESFVKAAF